MKIKSTLLLVIAFLLGLTIGTANFYNGLNMGVSWNRGGIEIKPSLSLFLCNASYDMQTQTSTHYSIPPMFESLVTDC